MTIVIVPTLKSEPLPRRHFTMFSWQLPWGEFIAKGRLNLLIGRTVSQDREEIERFCRLHHNSFLIGSFSWIVNRPVLRQLKLTTKRVEVTSDVSRDPRQGKVYGFCKNIKLCSVSRIRIPKDIKIPRNNCKSIRWVARCTVQFFRGLQDSRHGYFPQLFVGGDSCGRRKDNSRFEVLICWKSPNPFIHIIREIESPTT